MPAFSSLSFPKSSGHDSRRRKQPEFAEILREDLLWEWQDLIGNPAMGFVEAVKETVQRLDDVLCRPDRIAICFVEVFDGVRS